MGTHIRLTRSGGLAGLEMVASVDVDDLPADTAEEVRSALSGLHAERPHSRPAAGGEKGGGRPQGADRYQYDMVVEIDGRRRSLTAQEGDLTPNLRTLVDALLPFAEPQ